MGTRLRVPASEELLYPFDIYCTCFIFANELLSEWNSSFLEYVKFKESRWQLLNIRIVRKRVHKWPNTRVELEPNLIKKLILIGLGLNLVYKASTPHPETDVRLGQLTFTLITFPITCKTEHRWTAPPRVSSLITHSSTLNTLLSTLNTLNALDPLNAQHLEACALLEQWHGTYTLRHVHYLNNYLKSFQNMGHRSETNLLWSLGSP